MCNCYSDKETIEIVYHDDELIRCEKTNKGDWIDLRSVKTVELKAGEYKLIDLGVSMKLPKGYEVHLAPRSSTFKTYGLIQTNGIGIIDNSYASDKDHYRMPVYATRDTTIEKNDRICQFRIVKNQPTVIFKEVKSLDGPKRGGFGSSGVK